MHDQYPVAPTETLQIWISQDWDLLLPAAKAKVEVCVWKVVAAVLARYVCVQCSRYTHKQANGALIRLIVEGP
jgi:hypothetical protein